ncbi:MAG: CRISPR system precrRNA processing endoribonuclease RAMP protein Cas6 [Phototrophicaceae bacterium]
MISTLTLEFEIFSDERINFAGFAGVALRAALYTVFTELYDTGKTINSIKDIENNPLQWIFSPNNQSHTIPRPYIIRPPLEVKETGFVFGITLLGPTIDFVQQIISCVVGMQSLGLGVDRKSFKIKSIAHWNLLNDERQLLVDQNGNSIHPLLIPNEGENTKLLVDKFSSNLLKIKFLTPTTIINKRQLLIKPVFRPIFQRLLERTLILNKYYGTQNVAVNFDHLLSYSDKIQLINDNTRIYGKQYSKRYSRNIIGFIGDAKYQGEFASLLPFIVGGQLMNVGKNVTKGCGWFRVEQVF